MRRSFPFLILIALAGSACTGNELLSSPSDGLVGTQWRLVAFDTGTEGLVAVPDSQTFSAEFNGERDFHAEVDCNVCNGSYEASAGDLSIGLLACTRAYCGEASLHDRYLRALGDAAGYELEGSQLRIDYAGGVLRYERR